MNLINWKKVIELFSIKQKYLEILIQFKKIIKHKFNQILIVQL